MPQLITHNIFATEVYNKINNKIKKSIDSDISIYKMYAQSFDYFYYSFSKKWRKIGNRAHKKNVRKYFMNIINNIIDMNLENNSQALSYLYGSITHYVLDSNCHPLIFYKTGVFSKNDKKNTKKYMGLHGDFETNIDAFYYINTFKRSFHKVNTAKEFIPKIHPSNELKSLMNKTFFDTFNINNAFSKYYNSYKHARWLYPLFINDKHGIKKKIYKLYDKIIFFRNNNYEYYSTYIKHPNFDYLNIKHHKWCYPSDKTITSKESFIDLYNKSLEKACNLITLAHQVLNKEKNIKEFEKNIGNLSYVRGLDWKNSTYMKYFEF